jgi:hypothetical protein
LKLFARKMVGYGFRNFNGLKDKFSDMAFNIEGVEQRQRDFSNAKQIKQVMESILYCVENMPEASRREFVANYKDTQFACGDGTLQNLIEIFSEMQLGKADIAAYIAWAKREVVKATFVPMYRENFFLEAGLMYHRGNERHDIDSLINAVADEFGLVVRTQQEDRFIKDASRYREFLLGELNRVFAKPEVIQNISVFVANKIFENLQKFIDTKQPLKNQVQDFLAKLGVGDKYSYFHLVNLREDKFKTEAQLIINLIVKVYFHVQGLRNSPSFELDHQSLRCAGSYKIENEQEVQVITRENFPQEVEVNGTAVKLILFQDVELDEADFGTKNQVLYFARKHKNIFAFFKLDATHLKLLLRDVSAEELKNIEIIPAVLLSMALFFARTPEHIDVLLAKGADFNVVNSVGNNAVKNAEVIGRKDIVEKFTQHGIAPINVFEGYENGVNPKHEEMVVNTISKTIRWLSRDNLLKIIKCGMVNALKKALETPAGRELLLVEDSKGNVASHRAAYHPNPELFLEILKTEEGRKTLSFGNHDSELVVDVLIEYGRVDLINEVLKTKEGKAAILVETEYEANNYAGIRTLLKCNISLDQIFKYQDNKGMVQDAVDEDDFEAFQVFMERAELRNKVFAFK